MNDNTGKRQCDKSKTPTTFNIDIPQRIQTYAHTRPHSHSLGDIYHGGASSEWFP